MASSLWFGIPKDQKITTRSVSGPTFDSYRAEIDEIKYFLELLQTLPDEIAPQQFEFTLDNEAEVQYGNSPSMMISSATIDRKYFAPRFHLHHCFNNQKHSINFMWIRYHQDYSKTSDEMTTPERNKVLYDSDARRFAAQQSSQEQQSSRPAGLHMALASPQGIIVENLQYHLTSSV